jgi:hypothetical protein
MSLFGATGVLLVRVGGVDELHTVQTFAATPQEALAQACVEMAKLDTGVFPEVRPHGQYVSVSIGVTLASVADEVKLPVPPVVSVKKLPGGPVHA